MWNWEAPRRFTPIPHVHEAVIISGMGALRLDEREEELGAGDVLSVNPDQPHAIVNPGSVPLRFVCLDRYVY